MTDLTPDELQRLVAIDIENFERFWIDKPDCPNYFPHESIKRLIAMARRAVELEHRTITPAGREVWVTEELHLMREQLADKDRLLAKAREFIQFAERTAAVCSDNPKESPGDLACYSIYEECKDILRKLTPQPKESKGALNDGCK
jgi:hypothetical protein